jgi:hypothetical protein
LRLPLITLLVALLFEEIPDIWLLPDAGLIIASTLYVVLCKRRLTAQSRAPHNTPTAR